MLVVGGAGYIGGTTSQIFSKGGHQVTVFDNLSTGHRRNIAGLTFVQGDILKPDDLTELFADQDFDIVLHFAAKIRVDESVTEPKTYLVNNTFGALNVIDAAALAGVKNFVFSSSAAVYGEPAHIPVTENSPTQPINPYGTSKRMTEMILEEYGRSKDLNWVALRYFNAAGAYQSIGPDYPFTTHLIPSAISALLAGKTLQVFGTDYDTPDGSCVRDYVHVADLAGAHLKAAELMLSGTKLQTAFNLGSGQGSSVLEIISAIEKAAGQKVSFEAAPRRAGDPARLLADASQAKERLGWTPTKSLDDIVSDTLAWKRGQIA